MRQHGTKQGQTGHGLLPLAIGLKNPLPCPTSTNLPPRPQSLKRNTPLPKQADKPGLTAVFCSHDGAHLLHEVTEALNLLLGAETLCGFFCGWAGEGGREEAVAVAVALTEGVRCCVCGRGFFGLIN